MSFDIVIIGAGPAGLCFVRSLAGSGLRIALVERQQEAALVAPADDGREIAITYHSRRLLRELGLWARLREEEIGTLRDAMVLDGDDRDGLMFRHGESGQPQLGWLLPNHAIRRAAYAEVMALPEVRRVTGVRVTSVRTGADGAEVALDNGESLHALLVVAADSRFSETRRAMGIAASMRDFGKTMLVLRMRHAVSHEQTAWEWFGFGQTLALLPLHDQHTSSVVLTLPPQQMQALLAQDDATVGIEMAERFQQRLGALSVAGPRCAYPLVGGVRQTVRCRTLCTDRRCGRRHAPSHRAWVQFRAARSGHARARATCRGGDGATDLESTVVATIRARTPPGHAPAVLGHAVANQPLYRRPSSRAHVAQAGAGHRCPTGAVQTYRDVRLDCRHWWHRGAAATTAPADDCWRWLKTDHLCWLKTDQGWRPRGTPLGCG